MLRTAWSICFASTALAACGAELPPSDTVRFQLSSESPATGVAFDRDHETLAFLLSDFGIVETDRSGRTLTTFRFGERGLAQGAYTDLAKLADGSYALSNEGNVARWSPASERYTDYFCLVPGWQGPEQREWSVNAAVTIDPIAGRVFVAPARYRSDADGNTELIQLQHAQYAAADGRPITAVDVMDSGIQAQGLAYVPSTSELYAVNANQLYAFDLEGRVKGNWTLPGIELASGLAYDPVEDRLWITESSDREVVGLARTALTR
jgi:hypothetical protein